MNALTTLAERCESAGADEQRALLEEAWDCCPAVWATTKRAYDLLSSRLDAHAYVDAALMFVPEGMRYHLTVDPTGGFAGAGSAMATVKTGVRQEEVYGEATTPALAILSASLRAWADRSE